MMKRRKPELDPQDVRDQQVMVWMQRHGWPEAKKMIAPKGFATWALAERVAWVSRWIDDCAA